MNDIIDTIRMQMLTARRDNEESFFLMSPGRRGKSNLVGTMMGLPVFISPLCASTEPVREHKQAMRKVRVEQHPLFGPFAVLPRDKGCYHKRIQKKWNKRFGTKVVDHIYVHSNAIVISQATFARLALVGFTQ
jgi:hypothetical protein